MNNRTPSASRLGRAWRWLRRHASPRVILPLAVALGLIAYISTLASAPQSAGDLWTVVQQTWILILGLTVPYLIARALVWFRLMRQLGIDVPLRQAAVSFAGGEITKSLPGGIYVENYLLSRLVHFNRHSTIRSSMATTAMLGLESAVAVPIAMIVGVPGTPWLFWLLLGIVLAWLVVLLVTWFLVHHWLKGRDRNRQSLLYRAVDAAEEFLEAGGELLSWQTAVDLIPTALYMLIYVIDLYAIDRALGINSVTFLDTVSMYAVIVLAVVLIPIPTELGITELTGLGVLVAYGIPHATAALAMLSLRLLATGFTILVAGLILLVLRDELAQAGSEAQEPATA